MVHPLRKAHGFPRFQMLSWIWVGCFVCQYDAVSDAIPQAPRQVSPVRICMGAASKGRAGLAQMEILPRLWSEDD